LYSIFHIFLDIRQDSFAGNGIKVQFCTAKEVIRGAVSRAAGEHLLAKICLATGDFQQAVDATTRCINDYGLRLMTERFGINMDDKSKDVYNDLFQEENISIVENKEGIMISIINA